MAPKFNWNDYAPTQKSGYVRDLSGLDPMQKANLIISDFTSGGALPPKAANAFLVQAVLQSKFLTMVTSDVYDTSTFRIPSAQFVGQVLNAGTEGMAVPAGQRSKPVFTQAELNFKLFKGQVRIDDGVFENNVEREKLNNTIMGMLDVRIAADIEFAAIQSDTSITTNNLLSQFNGLLKQQTSYVVAGTGTKLDKTILEALYLRLPSQYRQDKSKMGFFTASDAQVSYINSLGNRVGEIADRRVTEGEVTPKWGGIPVVDVPLFPTEQGNTSDQTSISFLDPKNFNIGFQRAVKIEAWRDPDAQQTVVNVSVKFDCALAFEPATAKATGVSVALS